MVSRALASWELSEGEGASPLVPRPSADTPGRSAAPSESVKPSRCGARYHNGYSMQTCLLAKGHRGRHSDGW
jgi:hypothetical protein